MTASRARAGHARTKRTGVASRALAALAVVATAASTLVVSQVAAPQAAQAAQAGMEASKQYVAKFGRAKSYKEQTIGTPDAGAASMAFFFQGLAQV